MNYGKYNRLYTKIYVDKICYIWCVVGITMDVTGYIKDTCEYNMIHLVGYLKYDRCNKLHINIKVDVTYYIR